ncbi:tetratricopeptide repeat protein [Arcicella aquatica]|uniref:Tetratricopeptide repeat protein n=1 Tax=Arcicella aquatica TaxID=217141 RepID=A0ABU5QRN1_9BACT|nr:tetratricopeptide repeat protein [Arcicella aquatica]MEA5259741.1 tetratricopeptide repeat protein [Arcicella aquatica]
MGNSIDNKGNHNNNLQDVDNSNIHIGDNYHYPKPTLPKELTIRMPTLNLKDVIGREEEIEELHSMLFENKQVVLVNGLGGIGKTTLSQAYLTKYAEQYQHLAWISVSGSSLENDFVNAVLLDKTFNIKKEGKELADIFHELLNGFKTIEDKPNLLIIDNADATLSDFYDRLPDQLNWHLLVTSREKIEGFEPKEIGFLKPENALLLFQTHCQRINDMEAIERLLKTIDYHTLTIEILAKTAQLQRVNIETLQNAIDKDIRAGVYIQHNQGKIDKVYSYLSSIFDLSNLSSMEEWLIKQMACLPADFHTYDLIKELICKPESEQEEFLSETLESLVNKGWIMKNEEADSYKMHIVVVAVTRRRLNIKIADITNLLDNVTNKLTIDQTKDNPIDKFIWVPFGETLNTISHLETEMNISRLQNRLALVLQELGDYEGAKKLLEKALISDEKNFGQEHPKTASTYSNLATALQDLGDFEKAKVLFEKALNLDEKNFGQAHPMIGVRYCNLATVLYKLGDYERAKKILEKALILHDKNFEKEHLNTVKTYSNLATVLQGLGEYEQAKKLFEKVLILIEKNFGKEHPNTAVSYSNLATVLYKLADYEGSKKLLEKALMSDEKNFGQEHPKTAIRYTNLGLVLKDLRDYKGAKKLFEKALILAEKNLGQQHPTTAVRYSNLALALQGLGEYEQAKKLLEKALISDEKNFGESHYTTAVRYSNLGLVLKDLGDYEKAITLLEKSYNVFYNHLGEQHPNTKVVKRNLAYVIQENKKRT